MLKFKFAKVRMSNLSHIYNILTQISNSSVRKKVGNGGSISEKNQNNIKECEDVNTTISNILRKALNLCIPNRK